MPIMVEPTDPTAAATMTQLRIWEKRVDEHVKRQTYLVENMKTVYSLLTPMERCRKPRTSTRTTAT
jgi:hypothetical protein